jgi:hypothetical protein
MNVIIIQRLVCLLGGVTILSFAGRRHWLTYLETALIGTAMIFAATGWILPAILNVTIADFPDRLQAVLIASAIMLPLDAALIVGLFFLVKSLKRQSKAERQK